MSLKKCAIVVSCAAVFFALLTFCSCARGNGSLRISVTDTDSNALWGAKVVSESQPAGQLKIDGITSVEAGGVVFNGIKAGKYQIQVSRYGYAPESLEITVQAGKTESMVVKLFIASPPPVT